VRGTNLWAPRRVFLRDDQRVPAAVLGRVHHSGRARVGRAADKNPAKTLDEAVPPIPDQTERKDVLLSDMLVLVHTARDTVDARYFSVRISQEEKYSRQS
jgi:hypothetical protein